MATSMLLVLFVLMSTACVLGARIDAEPVCTSRFDFEEKLLQKMVRLEHAMELLQDGVNKQLTAIQKDKNKLSEELNGVRDKMKKEQNDVLTHLTETKEELKMSVSTFIENTKDVVDKKLADLNNAITKAGGPSAAVKAYAFYVQNPRSDLVDSVPIFRKTVLNEGEAYTVDTGKFVAPVDGIYQFTITVRSNAKGYIYCYIREKDTNRVYAISDGTNDMASQTVYLKLTAGIPVFPYCGNWENVVHEPTSFSGSLVFAL